MVIEHIEIRRFGKLSGFSTDFDPAFNLIEGPNESGKTTLAAFLFYMLYGFCDKEAVGALSERVLRTSWGSEEIGGVLILSEEDVRYKIERSSILTKNGKRDLCAVTSLADGESVDFGASPGEYFLGVSREVFENTAFFDAADGYLVDGDEMTDAIENIVFSGNEKLSLLKAIVSLKEVKSQLLSDGGKSGALISLEKEMDALRERLDKAKARERVLLQKENLLFMTREKRKECMRELAKFHRLETDYHNAMMIRDYDHLHELEDVVAEKESVIKRYEDEHRTGSFLPSVAYLTELSTAKAQLDGAIKTADEKSEILKDAKAKGNNVTAEEMALLESIRTAGDEDTVRKKVSDSTAALKKSTVFFSVFFALALTLGIFSIVMIALSRAGLSLALAALALVSLGVGTVAFLEYRRTRTSLLSLFALAYVTTREAFLECLATASEVEKRDKENKERLSAAEEMYRNAEIDRSAKIKLMESALRRLRPKLSIGEESYAAEVEALYREVEVYVEHATVLYSEKAAAEAEVKALRARLAGQNEIAVRALVPPDKRAELCSHNPLDLRHGVEHYEKMLESFTEKERTLEDELSSMKGGESSASVVEQMMSLETRMSVMREDASLYGKALETLHGSLSRLRTEVSPRLSLYACGMLDEMTDGKYSELKIGDDLSLSVLSEDGERSVGYLSYGTKQMTYFALRMALLDLLYKRCPPVCLDECLAHQDDERAASLMRALSSISVRGVQCFLFTSHERERRLARDIFGTYGRITLG